MGHVVDVAKGGQDSPMYPEHWACNRSAGGRLGGKRKAEAERARKRRPMRPGW